MSLTFRKLTNADFIGKCTQLQPNRMQCPKAASYLCSDSEKKRSVQLCTFHAHCMKNNIPLIEREENEQPTESSSS